MEHDLELISPILEIWIVRSICQSYPGNSGSCDPYISPILEIVERTIHTQLYPGSGGSYDPYSVPSWK